MSKIVHYIGIAGSIGIALSLFPQTYKTVRTGEMKDLSISFVMITMVSASCQLVYGCYFKILPMIIANVCVMANTFVLMIYRIYLNYNSVPNTLV